MNSLDILIVVIFGFFASISFFRGFVREAFTLGGLILGVVLANAFYPFARDLFLNQIELPNPAFSNILAYLVIFLIVSLAMYFLGMVVEKFVKLILLKWLDRLLGFVFGFTKGFLVVAVLTIALGFVMPPQSRLISDSMLLPYIESAYAFFPDNLTDVLMDKKEGAEKYLKDSAMPVDNTQKPGF